MRQKAANYFIRKRSLTPLFIRRYLRPAKKIIFLLCVFALLVTVYYWAEARHYFDITDLSYSGVVKFVNRDDIENMIKANTATKTFFTLKPTEVENLLKSNFLAIKHVKAIKKPLNKLIIQIQERLPVAIVIDAEEDRYLIDDEGYILGVIDGSYVDLPTLKYEKKLFIGGFLDTNIIPIAIEILNSAKIEHVEVSSLSFKPESTRFYSAGAEVLLNQRNNIGETLKIVSRLFQEGTKLNQKITKIDLRYEKVIVSYE